eukprot:1841360-Amphidinium_carterae.2
MHAAQHFSSELAQPTHPHAPNPTSKVAAKGHKHSHTTCGREVINKLEDMPGSVREWLDVKLPMESPAKKQRFSF